MIYGMDLAIVGGDDRFTDRQSDAHAAFGVCGGGWSRRCSIEDTFQPVRCNSISMIPDMNLDLGIVSGEITLNRLFTSGMEISIFQKIDDDLLDQQWIHCGWWRLHRKALLQRLPASLLTCWKYHL